MKLIYSIRASINYLVYRIIIRPLIFLWEAEYAHNQLKRFGSIVSSSVFGRFVLKSLFYFQHKSLNTTVDGITYNNPIGLSAGFDKDGELTDTYPLIGFGFAELGSFTGDVCPGNPGVGRRLFRLVKSKSILVWYGLNNQGAQSIAKRLKGKKFKIPIGISAAKTNNAASFDLQDSIDDYLKTVNAFTDIGHYYTINISCPNTQDGEPFVDQKNLDELLSALDKTKQECKPVYIKMAADLEINEINTIVDACLKHKIDGLVLTNLTKPSMSDEYLKDELTFDKGALSGLPVQRISTNVIRHVYQRTRGKITIIGVGGVFNAEDAYEKITSGANLIEMITGMIFEGPQVVGEINRGLVELLKKDGFTSIEEAVGSRNPLL
ncbi:quinone-dependent dihydroorotate dehydrogenase [Candidatus Thioglobus sp.]|uniref:quinone-dependent dihydroorotate dehydrogenase n=1 Tax=Candidatus Thioglobus sp. TaxID=2026721 RepID=UPI0026128942|nr:quinone-dependent dihydroorotate dehydrogenase [Candidatus Thioglobus sp.]MDG2395413.1 quinone-dependent dihydroorotate dehydrogenase [Candidatus Thioglobus sp.]